MSKQRVLFLCTGNSARSQMAEGLLRQMAGERFEVCSAGTRPAGLHPNAVRAMAEIGINIREQRSKSVEEFAGQSFDYIFTVCDAARQQCPIFHGGGRRIHQSFEDPAAVPADRQLEVFRAVRDQLRERIEQFVNYEA